MTKISFTKKILPSGLLLLNFYDPLTKSVGIEYCTKASTSINPQGKWGLAHFTEHLMFRQSQDFPDSVLLGSALEEIGANKNASTSHFLTSYFVRGGVTDFDRLLYILSSLITRPHITEESFQSEKNIIKKEIIKTKASTERYARDLLWRVMFNNSPLSHSNLGSEKSLDAIQIEDVQTFIKKNYLANNSCVIVWGGAAPSRVFPKITKAFSSLNQGEWKSPEFDFKRNKKVVIAEHDSDQVSFQIGFSLPAGHEHAAVALVAQQVLCSGWTSRLVHRLRVQESLMYTWGAHVRTVDQTNGLFLSFSTHKAQFEKFLSILSEEIVAFKNRIYSHELDLAKNKIIKPFAWRFESAGSLASWYASQEFFHPNDVESPEEFIHKVEKVSKKNIIDFSRSFLTDDNYSLSVVGDVKKKSTKLKLEQLQLG